jgi:hypothetical protein
MTRKLEKKEEKEEQSWWPELSPQINKVKEKTWAFGKGRP